MQCYNPRLAFRTFDGTKIKFTRLSWSTYIIHPQNQKPKLKQQFNTLFTNLKNTDLTSPLKIPCSTCEACVLNRAGELARRAFDEFKSPAPEARRRGSPGRAITRSVSTPPEPYTGMFLTLTYDNNNVPSCGHFDERDIVLFVKRLRKICPPIRTLGVAEYGEKTGRAHFHLLIFGYEFPDKKLLRKTDSTHTGQSYDIFTSKTLTNLWNKGITEFGSVTEQSCSYVARYLFKKNKKESEGEPCEKCQNQKPKKSKIVCRSRRPGLGANFCDRFITRDRLHNRENEIRSGNTGESLPRYYLDRIRKTLTSDDCLLSPSQPDYTKDRTKETKERLNAQKIIDSQNLSKLYKNKI